MSTKFGLFVLIVMFNHRDFLSDLQLAAQLGKVLLERNKDLEEQVRQAQVIQYEQAKEIEVSQLRPTATTKKKTFS